MAVTEKFNCKPIDSSLLFLFWISFWSCWLWCFPLVLYYKGGYLRGLLETEKSRKKSPKTAKPKEFRPKPKTEIEALTNKILVVFSISLYVWTCFTFRSSFCEVFSRYCRALKSSFLCKSAPQTTSNKLQNEVILGDLCRHKDSPFYNKLEYFTASLSFAFIPRERSEWVPVMLFRLIGWTNGSAHVKYRVWLGPKCKWSLGIAVLEWLQSATSLAKNRKKH